MRLILGGPACVVGVAGDRRIDASMHGDVTRAIVQGCRTVTNMRPEAVYLRGVTLVAQVG